jgi:polyisoprenoid-binding protein YceI
MTGKFVLASLLCGITALPFAGQQKTPPAPKAPPAKAPAAKAPEKAGGGPSGRFTIDPVHSNVIFKIRHMGVSDFYGRFDEVTGMIMVDGDDPAESIVKFSIPAAKVDTNNPDRDKHLRGGDFFNADEFKTIEFESTKIEAKDKDDFELTGDLTLHGVKKSVTADAKLIGFVEKSQMGARVGYVATLKIRRSDFGMKRFLDDGALGDDVELIVSVEAGK